MNRLFSLRLCESLILLSSVLLAEPAKEEPVGLVLQPGSAKLLRAGVETPLAAKAGDILFSGDAMKTESAQASFLYCPSKSSQSLMPDGLLQSLTADQIRDLIAYLMTDTQVEWPAER